MAMTFCDWKKKFKYLLIVYKPLCEKAKQSIYSIIYKWICNNFFLMEHFNFDCTILTVIPNGMIIHAYVFRLVKNQWYLQFENGSNAINMYWDGLFQKIM